MDDLKARARRAYELGRLRRALPFAVLAGLLAIGSTFGGVSAAWAVGGLLASMLVLFRWIGQTTGDAVLPGLAAGLVGYAVPLGWELTCCGCCGTGCGMGCTGVVIAGGVGAGAALLSVVWRRGGTIGFVAAAFCVAIVTSSLGCLVIGGSGLYGVGAVTIAAIPAAIAATLR